MGQKMVLLALADLARPADQGRCWPKVETLATLVGGKVRAVQGYLQELERNGIIKRVGWYQRRTVFQLTDPQQWPRLAWSGVRDGGAETRPQQNLRGAESAGVVASDGTPSPQNLRGCAPEVDREPGKICALSSADSAPYAPQNLHPLNHPVKPPSKTTEENTHQLPLASLARLPDEPRSKPKSTGKRKRAPDAEVAAGWTEFWGAYPRKVAAAAAKKAWARIAPNAELRATILQALAAQRPTWAERDIRFTPHAATWLNAERWTDEPEQPGNVRFETAPSPSSTISDDERELASVRTYLRTETDEVLRVEIIDRIAELERKIQPALRGNQSAQPMGAAGTGDAR